MTNFCYSVFAHVVAKYALRKDSLMKPLAAAFIGPIAESSDPEDPKCDSYEINTNYAKRWFEGTEKIPKSINRVASMWDSSEYEDQYKGLKKSIETYVNDSLRQDSLPDLCSELYPVVMAAGPSSLRKKNLIEYFEQARQSEDSEADKYYFLFLTEADLFALSMENDINRKKKVSDRLKAASSPDRLLAYLDEKPKGIPVTAAPRIEEANYVEALLGAYESDSGITLSNWEDLEKDERLREYLADFKKERRYFYAAEAVREATRDTVIFGSDNLSYQHFQQEIEDGIQEKFLANYSTGYERMKTVVEYSCHVELNTDLKNTLHWIDSYVCKGAVHEFINDREEEWTSDTDYGKKPD